MPHKTIICDPDKFDEEYDKWEKSLKLGSYEYLNKIDTKHDGNNHYILYTVGIKNEITKAHKFK